MENLVKTLKNKLLKAIQHLEYSFQQIQKMNSTVETLSLKELEHWESFAARFGRAADFFLSKYMRTLVIHADPGFRGSFRDLVNQAEKLGIIDNAAVWIRIRELRNIAAHEYEEENLSQYFDEMRNLTPNFVSLKGKLESQ